MEKVGVYVRLSDEDRFKKNKNDDSESIANQKSMLIKYALEQNWEIVDIYSDDDYSGAGTYRPDFERMIKDCENGRINIVLCKTQSRFSRDMEVIEKYLHNKFVEWGVRFVSIVDNADTNNEANKKSRQINGLINEWYLEDLSNNVKKSLKNKREDGQYMGSFAPYGYLKDPNDKHKLIVDNNVAYIVREIFEKYKNGISYNQISKDLNARGILSPSLYKKSIGLNYVCGPVKNPTYKWYGDTVGTILRNEAYIGNLVQGKTTNISYKNHKSRAVPKNEWCRIENTHEAIVDRETWDLVQARLGKNECPMRNGEIHMFSQKVYCAECERVFMRNVFNSKGRNGQVYEKKAYLQCKGYKKYHTCDNNNSIRLEVLEEFVLESINNLLEKCNQEMLKKSYEEEIKKKNSNETKINNLNKEKVLVEKKIQECKCYFRTLYEDKLKGIITEDDFKMLKEDYSKDVEVAENRLKEIEDELFEFSNKAENQVDVDKILKKYKHIDKLNKFIVDEFIERIYIGKIDKDTNVREIRIVWNFEL